ncbi:hypothetical protein PPL_03483 [Heterostelium album PN500]|uniref:Uncharacterized protein n=1 Tax=Heterostelium pallidum (strain ATCC 26659 / Pp 5 / PN500) TaxID=670386 RepID=D3B507_HETP5|nr:hypothetical protein PPL_03483 [Heterostelium album PN500]EFA84405.1 hypothetical protein PPL_03483 [Heterostelium album PN500]|eukprot:XP_020436519.1 hypothetical protein PPL_03483 [Heterostelium album PN500]
MTKDKYVDINNIDFLDLMNRKWYQQHFGTKWFVAIRHCWLVVISSIWVFIPHHYYAGAVVIVPVFGVVIGAALSSWTIIANAAALIFASMIASLFSTLLTVIVPRHLYWIMFILVAIFVFIITSFANSRRWLTINTVRKVLVDTSTNLFFTQTMTDQQKYDLFWQQIVCALALLAAAILVNMVMPTLASRMFIVKAEKALRWMKIYYRGIGCKLVASSVDAAVASTKNPMSESSAIDQIWLMKLPLAKRNKKTETSNDNRGDDEDVEGLATTTLENNITDDQLSEIEVRLVNELNKLAALYSETNQERWNSHLLPLYDKLLADLEINFKQLMTLKMAISKRFSSITSRKIIGPMTPSLNLIIEEVYHQILFIMDILENCYKKSDISNSPEEDNINVPTQLNQSMLATEELVRQSKTSYRQLITAYQNDNVETLYLDDITRAQFCISAIMTIAKKQRTLVNTIYTINENRRRYPIQFEILIHGGWFILSAFPRYLYSFFTYFKKDSENENNTALSKLRSMFMETFILNNRWQFPLQLSVAYVSCLVPMYYIDGYKISDSFLIKSLWAVVSVSIVMAPSIGATVSRFIHRLFGTVIGAGMGLLISFIVKLIPNTVPSREVALLVGTFLCILPSSFFQQNPKFSYAGMVTGFTYIIIVFAPYQTGVFNEMNAVMRTFMLIIGFIWIILTTFIVFPFFTYRSSRPNLYKISHKMVESFGDIVNGALQLELESTPGGVVAINIGKNSQKSQEIADTIREISIDAEIQEFESNIAKFDQDIKAFSIPLIHERACAISDDQQFSILLNLFININMF